MIARCIGWAKEHPKGLLLTGTHLAAALVAATVVWFAHGSQTKTTTATEDTHAAAASSGASASHLARGPVDYEVDVGGWAPPVLPVFPDAPQASPGARACPGQGPAAQQAFPAGSPLAGLALPPGTKIRIHEGSSTADTTASTQSVATQDTHRELKEVLAAPPRLSLFLGGQLRPDTRGAFGAIVRVIGPISAQGIVVPDLSDPFHKSTLIVGAVVATPW